MKKLILASLLAMLCGATAQARVGVKTEDKMLFKNFMQAIQGAIQGKAQDVTEVQRFLETDPELVNKKDEDGQTALHKAAQNNSVDMVSLLMLNRGDINIQDNNGFTPLHLTVMNGHIQIVMTLLDARADATLKTKDHKTALKIAREKKEENKQQGNINKELTFTAIEGNLEKYLEQK